MELRTRLLLVILLFLPCIYTVATDWPQWRGPLLTGSTDETNLPDTLNKETMLWTAEMPAPSAATPIIYNSKVFISSTDSENDDLLAMCFDAGTGKGLWRKKLSSSGYKPPRNNLSSSSPVADESNVYFLYGNGDVFCLDHEGNIIWSRKLEDDFGPFSIKFGYSSSPLLLDDVLYVLLLRRNRPYSPYESQSPLKSYLIALDTKTGKSIFSHERKTDAVDETLDSYTTPIIFNGQNGPEIVIAAADYVTGHHPKTGDELWRYQYDTTKNAIARNIPSAVSADGMIFMPKPRGTETFALKLNTDKNPPQPEVVWAYDQQGPDCSTPAYYKGKLYQFDDFRKKTITCLNADSGEALWSLKLESSSPFYASATIADNKIYCINEAGKIFVLSATEAGVISTFDLNENPSLASIAVAHGRLFVRTPAKLYCFAKKPSQDTNQQKNTEKQG